MNIELIVRVCNFHVIFELIFGYIYISTIDLENKGLESTLFWIITTLLILLYSSSIFIGFMLSNSGHKFQNIIDVIYPPLLSLISFLFGDFEYYVNKMKINEISKKNAVYITWLINSICEFFIDIPKSYIFMMCEKILQEKPEVLNENKLLIQITKYLAFVGAFKGSIAILLALYSFLNFMLNDNINLSESNNNNIKSKKFSANNSNKKTE